MTYSTTHYDVVVVGAGFTGLAAAHDLAKAGRKVLVLESDASPGGLAGTFEFQDGVRIEKFYHHWFNNDAYVPQLVKELGLGSEIVTLASKTAMYFNGRQWRLSTPWDLLRFKPVSLLSRIRLGLLVFRVRKIRDWRSIEHLSIREWLEPEYHSPKAATRIVRAKAKSQRVRARSSGKIKVVRSNHGRIHTQINASAR